MLLLPQRKQFGSFLVVLAFQLLTPNGKLELFTEFTVFGISSRVIYNDQDVRWPIVGKWLVLLIRGSHCI